MKKTIDEKKLYNRIVAVLTLGAVLINIKNIYTNFNIDAEYAIAMSYRMLRGDGMFAQMWEPHQTSGFLAAIFIWIYVALFQTVTGVAVYLNVVGLFIKAAVAAVLYFALRRSVDKRILYLSCLFFVSVNPKNMLLPEFSNMQLWFSVLLFCALFRYLQSQTGKLWLVCAAVALCFMVLSYPTCALAFFGVAAVLFLYSEQKWKDILITGGCCFAGGLVYVGYFIAKLGLSEFADGVKNIVYGDASHNVNPWGKWSGFAAEILQVLILTAVCAALSGAFVWICSRIKKIHKTKWFLLGFAVSLCIYHFGTTALVADRYMYLTLYIAVMAAGMWACRYCNKTEKQIYVIGMILSFCNLFATLLLTNLTFLTSIAYIVLGVSLAFIPLGRACEYFGQGAGIYWRYGVILLFCAVTVFRGGFLVRAMQEENTSVLDLLEARCWVTDGPVKGILSDYMRAYIMNVTYDEWHQYVKPGDSILLVGADKLSVTPYLYEDVEIAAASTICTPSYGENLLSYWEKNPEKYPDVVVVMCQEGKLIVTEDYWIARWLEEDYRADDIKDGTYWRYYRKKSVDRE